MAEIDMKRLKDNLLPQSTAIGPMAVVPPLLFALFLGFFLPQGVYDFVKNNMRNPLQFGARVELKRGPQLHEKISIFALDDHAISYLDAADLSLQKWGDLLAAMAAQNPEAIYVDKLFASSAGEEIDRAFVKRIRSLKTPIGVGSFVTPTAVPGKWPLDLSQESYRIVSDSSWDQADGVVDRNDVDEIPFAVTSGHAYGPHKNLQDAFAYIGHITYAGAGYIKPFIRLGKESIIPHLTLMGSNKYRFSRSRLEVNGKKVSLNEKDQLLVNQIDGRQLYGRTKSIVTALRRLEQGKDLAPYIKEGQIVYILPGLYTGGTDFVSTPLGVLPGGFVLVSIFNSFYRSDLLSEAQNNAILIFACSLMGVVLGVLLSPLWWGGATLIGLGLLVVVGLLSFVYLGFSIAWVWGAIGFLVSSLWAFGIKTQGQRRRERDRQVERQTHGLAAVAVQKALIRVDQAIPGVEWNAFYQSADIIGGDWYGIFRSQNKVFALIGDVSGHGFASALITGAITGTVDVCIASIEEQGLSLKEGMLELNRRLQQTMKITGLRADRTLTMAMVGFDQETKEAFYLNRAHNCIFIIRGGRARPILTPGSHLGTEANIFRLRPLPLKRGDIVFMYTDGLVENTGPDGRVLHMRYLTRAIAKQQSAMDVVRAACEAGNRVWSAHPPADDCAMLALKWQAR